MSEAVDEVVRNLYHVVLKGCWAPEIKIIEDGYQALRLPFDEVSVGRHRIERVWDMDQFVAFMKTWSASETYWKRHDREAVDAIREDLTRAWGGEPAAKREIAWDLDMRAVKVRPDDEAAG